jgi:hypothetical protein
MGTYCSINIGSENDGFELSFEMEKEPKLTANGELYYEFGPLVLCRELNGLETVTKRYGRMGFQES